MLAAGAAGRPAAVGAAGAAGTDFLLRARTGPYFEVYMTTDQQWKQVSLITDGEKSEEVSDILFFLGAVSVTFEDAKDDPVLEPKPGEQRVWPNTRVIGLFEKGTDTDPVVSYLSQLYGDHYPIAAHDLEDRDWVRAWMENFKPIKCGRNLWITPSWCTIDEGISVVLDPGLAFGTGSHPTTHMCLGFLDSLGDELKDREVVDFGCGSGVLAIAALKLGAARAYGIDIDPQAILASRDNAQRNKVADRLELFEGDSSGVPQCPVVVANILAGPLAELEPVIASLCAPGGRLALSGILDSQAQEVIDAYSKDFTIDYTKNEKEWVLIAATRKQ